MKIEVAPFSLTPSDLLGEFVPLVPKTLDRLSGFRGKTLPS